MVNTKKLILLCISVLAGLSMHAMWRRPGWQSQTPSYESPSRYEQWRNWFLTKRSSWPLGIPENKDYVYQEAERLPNEKYKSYYYSQIRPRESTFHHIPLNPYGFRYVDNVEDFLPSNPYE